MREKYILLKEREIYFIENERNLIIFFLIYIYIYSKLPKMVDL